MERSRPLAPRKARLDLLEEPAVGVRITERRPREVGATVRVGARHACICPGAVERPTLVVVDLAHFDTAAYQIIPGQADVVHDEHQILRTSGPFSDMLLGDASYSGLRSGAWSYASCATSWR